MPDVFYQFTDVPRNPASHLARMTIIRPLAGKRVHDASVETMLRGGLSVLLDYRKLLVTLRDAGWGIFNEHPKLMQKMRNCPPSMFVTEDVDKCTCPCDCFWFCPWCYGRWVKDVFHRIERSIQPDDKLMWTIGRHYEPLDQSIRLKIQRHRQMAAKLNQGNNDCKGSILYITTEPYVRKGKKCLRVSHRHIALLCRGERFLLVPSRYIGQTVGKLTRKKLASRLTRVLRYPEHLFRGEPEDVVAIVNARRGLRLCESYGCLRAAHATNTEGATVEETDNLATANDT